MQAAIIRQVHHPVHKYLLFVCMCESVCGVGSKHTKYPWPKDMGNNSDSDSDETEAEVKVQKKSLHLFAVETSLGHGSECRKRRNRSRAQDAPDVESRDARRYFRLIFGCISISQT